MIKKVLSILSLVILIHIGFKTEAYANPFTNLSVQKQSFALGFNASESWGKPIQIKRGEPYDEKKDPALRKGTENEEMPQGSFFAIPGLLVGVVGLLLWFNRDKD